MKAKKLLASFLVLSFVKAGFASSYDTLAKHWYERRAEGAEGASASPGPINMAIAYYEKSFWHMSTEEKAVALLRCYYFKGSFVQMSPSEQKNIFTKGKKFGHEMAVLYPSSVPVKYWLAAILGKWAKVHGPLYAAKAGIADKVKSLGEEIIMLDPEYNDAGGYQILGLVHLHSPVIPFFLTWPSEQLAIENLQTASRLAPTIANNLWLAKAVLKKGNKTLAISLLKKSACMIPREERIVEDRYSLELVAELLSQLTLAQTSIRAY